MEEKVGEFTRKIVFRPGFDKRDTGHGVHNMELGFVLIGPMGAVSFSIVNTGWYQESVRAHLRKFPVNEWGQPYSDHFFLGSIDSHSRVPSYEGQTPIANCGYLGGEPCYCDGTTVVDNRWEEFLTEGEPAVWKFLEEYYNEWLKDNNCSANEI